MTLDDARIRELEIIRLRKMVVSYEASYEDRVLNGTDDGDMLLAMTTLSCLNHTKEQLEALELEVAEETMPSLID